MYGEGGWWPVWLPRDAWRIDEHIALEFPMQTFLKGIYASLIAAVLVSGSAVLTGCNTTEGAGKDIKSTGNAIENAAHDAKD